MTSTTTATITAAQEHGGPRRKRAFARHFGEMLLAMFLGMAVLGGLAELLLSLAGASFSDQAGVTQVMIMGIDMTIPMVLWMRYRGHPRARNIEMAASMIVPSLIAATLAMAGLLDAHGAMAVQHAVMIPAMLGVMLWRYEHYAGPHHH